MELGTVSCCLARAELFSVAGQCSLFWHFPGPTCLVFKQRLQRELFHAGFLSPHQAASTTGSLCASSHCCWLGRSTAPAPAPPASCQDTDAASAVSAQRCSVSFQRNNLCFSNVGCHLCQGSNAFKFPVPLLFLTSETLTANLLRANMLEGTEQENRGQSVSKPFHTASFPVQRSFLPLPSDASK